MHTNPQGGKKPRSVIVNAIPIVNVSTGIGRYILSLYKHIEKLYADEWDIGYFDGATLHHKLPLSASNRRSKSTVNLLWKMPPLLAFLARSYLHSRRERRFMQHAASFDLYHETSFFPFRTATPLPVVFTIHDISLYRFPAWHPKERVMFYNRNFPRRLGNVAQFLSVSHFTKAEMIEWLHVDPARVTVTQNAYDEAIFAPPLPADVAAARARYALPERYFLFVGSGDPRKNFRIIPAALAHGGLDVPLVNVGWPGWLTEAPRDASVINTGFVDDADLAKLYAGALALIYPSIYEGFGLPVLEAMACGCPVVTTRCASLPEVGGEAALYLERHDSEVGAAELAALLRRLAGDSSLVAELRARGLARSRAFSWDRAAAETVGAFTKVLQASA